MVGDRLDLAVSEDYGGSPVSAILEIARRHGITLAYLDRQCFAAHVQTRRGEDRPLSDQEWDRVRSWLDPDEYDNFVDNSRGPSGNMVDSEFMNFALRSVGIEPPDEDEPWESDTDKEPGYRDGW